MSLSRKRRIIKCEKPIEKEIMAVRKLLSEEKVFYMKIGSRYYINVPKTIDFLTHNPIMDITWKEPVSLV